MPQDPQPPSTSRGPVGPHPGPGSRLGPYVLEHGLGQGGMASVYLGCTDGGELAAIKVLDPSRVLEEDVRRFRREHDLVAHLQHPNLVAVRESGETDGYPWFAMEYVDGVDLDVLIERWRRKDADDRFEIAERIARELASALAYLHDHGLIHRDLKPANVMLTRGGQTKLTDFGVVKGEDTNASQLTSVGRLVGTIAYMAPELISEGEVDARTDLYGLGGVLYTLLTLRQPIEADSLTGYLARHLTEVPTAPSEIDPRIPPVLDRLTLRLLAKTPAERPVNARAVLAALDTRRASGLPPLRGREVEMASWRRWLTNLEDGVGGTVLVAGPDGAGKTRLLQAFAEVAAERGLQVHGPDDTTPPPPEAQVVLLDDVHCDTEAGPAQVRRDQAVALVRDRSHGPRLVVYSALELDDRVCLVFNGARGGTASDLMRLEPLDARAAQAVLRDRGVPQRVAKVLALQRLPGTGTLPGDLLAQLDAFIEAGWLTTEGRQLRNHRPIRHWKEADLPVPPRVRDDLLSKLGSLAPDARELLELLAVLRRDASASLLERAATHQIAARRLLDHLRSDGWLVPSTSSREELVTLYDRQLGCVLRAQLDPATRQQRHLSLATALGRLRRRRASAEVADHLAAANHGEEAAPIYLHAGRRAARGRRFREVLDLWQRHTALGAEATRATADAWDRLAASALVEERRWREAIRLLEPLVLPTDAAIDRASEVELARAYYRTRRFDEARALLETAIPDLSANEAAWGQATRVLADILMRTGELPRAEALLRRALASAQQAGSTDAQARVRRGLAHTLALHNDFLGARDELERAEELMLSDQQPYLRAGVLARAIELDLALGRLGVARHRAALLIDLLRHHSLGDRIPRALSLQATVDLASGQLADAARRARESLLFALGTARPSPQAVLRALRVQASLHDIDEHGQKALELDLHDDVLSDPKGQHLALSARIAAVQGDTDRARELVAQALARPAPPWSLPRVHLALDAGHALLHLGDHDGACAAADTALAAVAPAEPPGVLIQAWTLKQQAGDPAAVPMLEALCRQVSTTLDRSLHRSFLDRAHRSPAS